mgnify:CR=1 FL=1
MNEILKTGFLTDTDYLRVLFGILILFGSSRLIELVFTKYTYSNDNKALFTKHMFPFVLAIFLIVTVIKTSIALSLGLVGALSIIRFRTAIKEPGQLIALLVLTALAISMAAEKELLGVIITFIYSIYTAVSFKALADNTNYLLGSKILRVSVENSTLSLHEIIDIGGLETLYSDINKVVHIEFSISNDVEQVDTILKRIREKGSIKTYEII